MRRARILLMSALCASPLALAQTGGWPKKSVRIVVAAASGSADDLVVRLMAPKLGELLGQQFIVDNRPGGSGLIGQSHVQKALPDGYVLLLAGGSMAGMRYVNANVNYDVLSDFTPISRVITTQFVMLVHPAVPARDLKAYIGLARAQAGKMSYAVPGAGQIPYWSAVLFNTMAQIRAVEVSYKTGSAGALPDVMAGRVDYIFTALPIALTQGARLRALAVTGASRSRLLPRVPTIAEAALPGYEMPGWASIMGPAGLPKDIVESLNHAIRQTLGTPDINQRMEGIGIQATPSTPEELRAHFADWVERFGKLARSQEIKPQ